MRKNLLYLDYLIRHKWYVFIAGLRLDVPIWRLLIHDWSKMMPSEWTAYREFFYGKRDATGHRTKQVKEDFRKAWLHHIHWNAHHWNYYFAIVSPFCGCYSQLDKWENADRNRGQKSRASGAEKSDQLPISSMEVESESFAPTITQLTGASGERQTQIAINESNSGTTETMQDAVKSTPATPENATQGVGEKCCSTMVEILPSALAAGNPLMSFWRSITRTGKANNTERMSSSGRAGRQWFGGPSGTASRISFASSATTATRPSDTTDIVRTSVIVDTDGIYCLMCGKKGSLDNIEPRPIPLPYLGELVADWYGAGRAISGRWRAGEWYEENKNKIVFHPETRAAVEALLQRAKEEFGWS